MLATSTDHARQPMRLHRGEDLVIAAFVWVAAFAGLTALMPRGVGMYDEGIMLTDAMRVATGEMVHRDFYSNYGPAQYYIVAAVLKASHGSYLAARIYDLASKALICGLVFYVARHVTDRIIALGVAGAAGFWLLNFGSYPFYPIYPCIVLGLVATNLMTHVVTGRGSLWRAATAGILSGVAALFRYDTGFMILVANLGGAILLTLAREAPGEAFRRSAAIVIAYGLGTCLIFVPVAGAYLLEGAVGGFWHDIIAYPTRYYAEMRGLPFPRSLSREAGGVYFTPLVAGLGLIEAGRMFWRERRDGANASDDRLLAFLVMFSFCALCFFLKGLVRVSTLHMLLGNVPALVVAAILAQHWLSGSRAAQLAGGVVMVFAVGLPASLAPSILKADAAKPDAILGGLAETGASLRDAAACRTTPRSKVAIYGPDYTRVANYLARHTRPDERIFVALDHNDRIFVNAMALYFAAGRLPGTHWSHFDPGLQNRADIQAEIIADLQANRVSWVVRDGSIDNPNEPNGSAKSSGVTLLDDYLDANYRPVASSGRIVVWLKDTDAADAAEAPLSCEAAPLG